MTAHAPSLLLRLSAWLGLGIAVLWAASVGATFIAVQQEVSVSFDKALETTAGRLLPLAIVQIFDGEDDGTDQIVAELSMGGPPIDYIVRNAEGRVLIRSRNADPAVIPQFSSEGFRNTNGARVYTAIAMQGAISIAVAEPLHVREEEMREALRPLLTPTLLLLPVSLLLIAFVLRRELRTVSRLADDIGRRGGQDLSQVETRDVPRELLPVTDAVNSLLARLSAVIEAERRFASNAAHELRTPLAAALAQVQRLGAEATDPEIRDRTTAIHEALTRLSGLSEKLLQLARAEGSATAAHDSADAVQILRLVADEVSRSGDRANRLDLTLPDQGYTVGMSADSLAILARNLLENAFVHGTGPVRASLDDDRCLVVENDCPPIPPETLARLTEPLARGDTTADGSGLGLAIVRAIADATGSTLELSSPIPGSRRGFRVTVRLPVPA